MLDVIVIGAGQAGLATAYALRSAGLSFEMLEAAAEPGGAWSNYYDSLKLFSPARYSSLPGMQFPGDPARYPARDEVVEYLRTYARHFSFPVVCNVRVKAVEAIEGGFQLMDEQDRRWLCRALVVATGSFAQPHRPWFEGNENFAGQVLHAADYRKTSDVQGRRIAVVGAGNSAVQIA
ncbi:flavin-containing monooxygenase [Allohahella marinimesophila]|uniref:NAD(P)/FAD-dependent oxidoreductase n=1 Tax=Allohahella marinimesophila TaxID=1054972 RepID=A0ABP7NZ83_9GAMM